jgi:hypothetical protein
MAAISEKAAAGAPTRLGDDRNDRADRPDQPLSVVLARLGASLSRERVAPYISDASLFAGVAPRPAQAVVKHRERLSGLQLADLVGISPWDGAEIRRSSDRAEKRLGIMGRDDPACERDIREIFAVGIEIRIRRIGRPAEYKFVSAGGRRPGLGR